MTVTQRSTRILLRGKPVFHPASGRAISQLGSRAPGSLRKLGGPMGLSKRLLPSLSLAVPRHPSYSGMRCVTPKYAEKVGTQHLSLRHLPVTNDYQCHFAAESRVSFAAIRRPASAPPNAVSPKIIL